LHGMTKANRWLSDFSFEKLYRSHIKTDHFIFKISKLTIQIFIKALLDTIFYRKSLEVTSEL